MEDKLFHKLLLKTLVGSKAHGLDTPESDSDYRGVFIMKTSDMLKLGAKIDQTAWIEGDVDDTSYELSKFLQMAMKSNATVLEVLHGPMIECTPEGKELRDLFPYLWTSRGVLDAFRGYSLNQRKKFLDDKDDRPWKYAVAYIRVLLLGIELLRKNTLTIHVAKQYQYSGIKDIINDKHFNFDSYNLGTEDALRDIKKGVWSKGQVIDWANNLEQKLVAAYEFNPKHENDPTRINEYLLKVRKENW